MKKRHLIIFLLVVTSFLLIGCHAESAVQGNSNLETEELEATIAKLEQKNQELETLITGLTEENEELDRELATQIGNFDQLFTTHEEQVETILTYLNEEELKALSESQWQYSLSVNEVEIPESGVLEIDDDQIEITLSQLHLEDMSLLPNEILEQGVISGEFYHEHILQVTPEQDEETWRDGTMVTGFGLIFTDLTPGEEIELTITDELMHRLGFETTQVIIRKK